MKNLSHLRRSLALIIMNSLRDLNAYRIPIPSKLFQAPSGFRNSNYQIPLIPVALLSGLPIISPI